MCVLFRKPADLIKPLPEQYTCQRCTYVPPYTFSFVCVFSPRQGWGAFEYSCSPHTHTQTGPSLPKIHLFFASGSRKNILREKHGLLVVGDEIFFGSMATIATNIMLYLHNTTSYEQGIWLPSDGTAVHHRSSETCTYRTDQIGTKNNGREKRAKRQAMNALASAIYIYTYIWPNPGLPVYMYSLNSARFSSLPRPFI